MLVTFLTMKNAEKNKGIYLETASIWYNVYIVSVKVLVSLHMIIKTLAI